MSIHSISAKRLTIADLDQIFSSGASLSLSTEAIAKVAACRTYLDKKLAGNKEQIYGINTGFGALHNTPISKEDLIKLQYNLVVSHACGMGEEVPPEIVKLMLLLKVQGLSYGHSGVTEATVSRLVAMFNEGVLPIVYEQGSLGASGDLSPLAHLSLPLLGLGQVNYKGTRTEAKKLLDTKGWDELELKSKEGLALLNGTQFMSAYGVYCLIKLGRLAELADLIGAMSLDAFDGRLSPFHPAVHRVRNHAGQREVAANILKILEGSEIAAQSKKHVQDPYSFRCIPQVHGASRDVFSVATATFETEINSVTDNPTIFPEEDLIISAGNFHGQPLALALDQLAIAAAELGSISERRTYKLISGDRGLPPFLISQPGLNSGLMISHYTAASMVSQNKQLCTPASVDTIDSSNGQEDHVSMGANAATKALRVVNNLERILAIELLTAAQALDFRRPLKSSSAIEKVHSDFRKLVPFMEQDRLLHDDMQQALSFVQGW